jgi:hypothetical protein
MKINKTILVVAITLGVLVSNIQAKEIRSASKLYEKKCAMCHKVGKPQNEMEKKAMVAPPIDVAMRSFVITIDAVDGPFKDDELREETIIYLKDYLYEPTKEKTNCEDEVVKKFGRMPSLKGFVSPEELDKVVAWVYDTFKPLKNSKGEFE